MSGFEYNKIAAAILIALLVGLISSLVSDSLIHPQQLEKNVYIVEGLEETSPSQIGTPQEEILKPIIPLLASANIEKGKELYKKCIQCHTDTKGGPNKVGPNQWGVVGDPIAHRTDYAYSEAMKKKGGSWDYETLNAFLAHPKKFIPGTKMAFIGLSKPQDRADLIAYLRTMSDSPLPLPQNVSSTPLNSPEPSTSENPSPSSTPSAS